MNLLLSNIVLESRE